MSKVKKILLVIAILVGAGVLLWGVIWLVNYYQYRNSPQYQAQKYIDEMEKKYREDTYGGSTPEETLQLFIDALKAGDTDLASKYFVVEKWEETKADFDIGKNNGNLNKFLTILLNNKPTGKELLKGSYKFTYVNEEKILMAIDLVTNPYTNKWKIESL